MNFPAMELNHRAHNVKAQTNTAFILAAGPVGLVKPFKYVGQILRRNARSGIADGHQCSGAVAMVANLDKSAFVDKLHRVFD